MKAIELDIIRSFLIACKNRATYYMKNKHINFKWLFISQIFVPSYCEKKWIILFNSFPIGIYPKNREFFDFGPPWRDYLYNMRTLAHPL